MLIQKNLVLTLIQKKEESNMCFRKLICILMIIVFFCTISITSYAIEPIKKDEPAKTDGYIITPEEELKTRLELIEFDGLKKKYEVQEKKSDYWEKNYFDLSKDYVKIKKTNNWTTTLYFIGGLALGVSAVYLGGKVAKEI